MQRNAGARREDAMTKTVQRDHRALLDALRAAAGRPMTAEQIRQQKISFILGTLSADSEATREEIDAHLRKREGISAQA